MATCPTCRTHYPDSVEVCATDGARLLPDAAFAGADVDLKEGDQVGEYRIEVKLGEGGFGTVYRAQHPVIGKKAAIKILAREFSTKPEMVARFIDEARAVNQIRNKGIIDIFSFGSLSDGRQYFVMELLEGLVLDAYIKQKGRLTIGEALPILKGVARAVDAAHLANIAHRDLKPDNVFLVFDEDGSAHTKLLDFGIAKLVGEQSGKTRTGAPIGTPQYMSPEQARGQHVDGRTDVYSFGAMAYEMLTGAPPFEGASVMDILLKQISDTPPPPSTRCAELPPSLDAPILHMLEKEPEKRPPTLMAAVEELAAASGAPVSEKISGPIRPIDSAAISVGTARTVQATPHPETLIGSSTEIGQAPVARRRRRWWMPLAPLVILGSIAAFAFNGGRHYDQKHPLASVEQTTPKPSLTPSMQPSVTAPAMIDVVITSTPTADVYEGDQKLGPTPYTTKWPKASGKKHLTLKASGYTPQDVDVDLATGGVIDEHLERQAVKSHGTAASSGKPQGNVSGDLEKPFP